MSALEMKIESKELDAGNDVDCTDCNNKKCKSSRRKSRSMSFDKELETNDGSRVESNFTAKSDNKCSSVAVNMCSRKKRGKKLDDTNKKITKKEKIEERLQSSLSDETKKKISTILNDIKMLSDVEKLLLYLQLPTGSPVSEDPLKNKGQSNPLGKKTDEEGNLAVTWIQSHLEEDPDVSLPKQEVYDEYQAYCEVTGNEPLCAADFGKVMKQIFPTVKPRRLGTRGNSRYCYSGLRKKLNVSSPALPDLQKERINSKSVPEDEVLTAACHVLFEWAEKLLGMKFTSLKELASHLIENMFVDNRSVAAFTLLLSTSSTQLDKASFTGTAKEECKSKRSETQLHLQRKIQEKELIKEQKLKLQEHRSHFVTSDNKCLQTRRKGLHNRKMHLQSSSCGQHQSKQNTYDLLGSAFHLKQSESDLNADNSDKKASVESNSTFVSSLDHSENCQQPHLTFHSSDESSLLTNNSPPENCSRSLLIIEDSVKKKHRSKSSVTSNKSPVCIPQSLPGFIIVPSIQQVQLSDAGNKSNNIIPPKYKRIQPKPLNELKSSAMRCRTGSLGSAVLKEIKPRSDGRRSSLALMPSDTIQDDMEECSSADQEKGKNLKHLPSYQSAKTSIKCETPASAESSCDKSSDSVKKEQCFNSLQLNSPAQELSPDFVKENSINEESINLNAGINFADDVTRSKRPSEEAEFETATKKPHLEEFCSSDVSSESLSPWTKDVANVDSDSRFSHSRHNESTVTNKLEGVSIHELESDALIDYLRDVESSDNEVSESLNDTSQSNALVFNALQNKAFGSNETFNTAVAKKLTNAEVNQLSQLRILLEQNLPHTMIKSPRASVESNLLTKKLSVMVHANNLAASQVESLSSNKGNSVCNSELPTVLIRSGNPYLNHEEIISKDNLPENQVPSENLANDFSSTGLINEQDILAVMSESNPSFAKAHSVLVNTNNYKNLVRGSDVAPCDSSSAAVQQMYATVGTEHSSTQTQVPSVPPSPNTRRRAFNFMPISPRHTPVPEVVNASNVSCFSPIPLQHQQNMVSVAVGPSQPPSNAGSPFVSPRSTPVPASRSRHSSGQSTYSTSRHTPFQNFDSGVSSISSSPFISPQPTPVPVSRLRHNSSHGTSKSVTFSTANSNQVVHTLSSIVGHGPLRLRHNSGSASSYLGFSLSPRSAPLSPLVNETASNHFVFPSVNESRSRHSSGLAAMPLSPVSEQVLPSSSNNSNSNNLMNTSLHLETAAVSSDPFINHDSAKEMIGVNSVFKQTRQRHSSSSVIYSKPSIAVDPLAQEVQLFLKNGSENLGSAGDANNRSRSVPLHQMLQNMASTITFQSTADLKTIASITAKQSTPFSMLVSSSAVSSLPVTSSSLTMHCDRSLNPVQPDWAALDNSSDLELSSRRNLAGLLEGDDLQTTLEDLRDCDTDFSKFAQELELSQNDDGGL